MAPSSPTNDSRTESIGRKCPASAEVIVLSDSDDVAEDAPRKRTKQEISEEGELSEGGALSFDHRSGHSQSGSQDRGNSQARNASRGSPRPESDGVSPAVVWNAGAKSKIRTSLTLGGGSLKINKASPTGTGVVSGISPSPIIDQKIQDHTEESSGDTEDASVSDGGSDQIYINTEEPTVPANEHELRNDDASCGMRVSSTIAPELRALKRKASDWRSRCPAKSLLLCAQDPSVSKDQLLAFVETTGRKPDLIESAAEHLVLHYPNSQLAYSAHVALRQMSFRAINEQMNIGVCKKLEPISGRPPVNDAELVRLCIAPPEPQDPKVVARIQGRLRRKDIRKQRLAKRNATQGGVLASNDTSTNLTPTRVRREILERAEAAVSSSSPRRSSRKSSVSDPNKEDEEAADVRDEVNEMSFDASPIRAAPVVVPAEDPPLPTTNGTKQTQEMAPVPLGHPYEDHPDQRHQKKTLADLAEAERDEQIRYTQITKTTGFLDDPNIVGRSEVDLLQPLRCLICGQFGHIIVNDECPDSRDWSLGRSDNYMERTHSNGGHQSSLSQSAAPGNDPLCAHCHEYGHSAFDCLRRYRSFIAPPMTAVRKVKELPIGCYRCGADDHYGGDCPPVPRRSSHIVEQISDWTFCRTNAMRYLDPHSSNTATALPPGRAEYHVLNSAPAPPPPGQSHGNKRRQTQRGQYETPILVDDDDDMESFIRPRINRAGPAEPSRSHIRFSNDVSRSQTNGGRGPPPPPRHPLPRRLEPPTSNTNNDPYHYRPSAESSRSYGRGSDHGAYRGNGGDYWAPPGANGGGMNIIGRGRAEERSGDTYRPMPSAGRDAWRRHRI